MNEHSGSLEVQENGPLPKRGGRRSKPLYPEENTDIQSENHTSEVKFTGLAGDRTLTL